MENGIRELENGTAILYHDGIPVSIQSIFGTWYTDANASAVQTAYVTETTGSTGEYIEHGEFLDWLKCLQQTKKG